MALTYEQWTEKREQLEKVIPEIFAQHRSGKELQEAVDKWREPIILGALSYMEDEPIFESHAKADKAIERVAQLYQKFYAEYQKLDNHADIAIHVEARKYGVDDIKAMLKQIDDIFSTSKKSIKNQREYFKKEKLITQADRTSVTPLLFKLFDAYLDISNGNFKTWVYGTPKKKILKGEIVDFIFPVLEIFSAYQRLKPDTLDSLIEDTVAKHQKLKQFISS